MLEWLAMEFLGSHILSIDQLERTDIEKIFTTSDALVPYAKREIIWAKNYKIPFRSNLKIYENKLIGADQSNNLYFFDLYSGEVIKKIPTEETVLKNKFINNLSANENKIFYLNTY